MDEATSREKILKKVRKALLEKSDSFYINVDFKTDLFKKQAELAEIEFAEKFLEHKGNFVFCQNEEEACAQLISLFKNKGWMRPVFEEEEIFYFVEKSGLNTLEKGSLKIFISLCEFLVSQTGSILVSSLQGFRIRSCVDTNVHIVMAFTSQLVKSINEALSLFDKKYEVHTPRQITLITGPSKTADIEQ